MSIGIALGLHVGRGGAVVQPPSFVNAATFTTTSATNYAVNVPTGVGDGMLLVAAVSCSKAQTITAPAGWTAGPELAGVTAANRLATFYRIASSEPASYTWTLSGASAGCASIVAYRNIAQSSPLDGSGSQENAVTQNLTAPSISPATTGALLLLVGGIVTANLTVTPPATMTERVDITNATGFGLTIDSEVLVASGATGTRTATISVASRNIGIALAFKVA